MKNEITAKDARGLAGPTVEERVDDVLGKIKTEAKSGKRKLALHGWWANEGYKSSKDYKFAVSLLEERGFKVDFHYEERQFVDMYTVISW